ncbi:MAG: prepilin-type N-terminal cleavage/methylation domain-containing protein [bacterium]
MIHKDKGFTLIELLIVVAIIGVLAAIAVPNFLNAQARAKIARAKGDLQALSMANETYRLDHNRYPEPVRPVRWDTSDHTGTLTELTTPVSYIGSVDMEDPFVPRKFWTSYADKHVHPTYVYVYYRGFWGKVSSGGAPARYGTTLEGMPDGVTMYSRGPDGVTGGAVFWPLERMFNNKNIDYVIYASSNGLMSGGCVARFQGSMPTPSDWGG